MTSDAARGTRDRGAAHLLAIVVVTGVSVAIAAALGFAATSVRSSAESYRPARNALYKADAAVKLAAAYYKANADGGLLADCAVIHLQPGVHYLHDVDWQISDVVVGGTLSSGLTLATLDPATDLPGACDVSGPGTMIVLGGTSEMTLNGQGVIEVCGLETTQGADRVRIPLIGSDTGLAGTGGGPDVTLTGPTSATASGITKTAAKTASVQYTTTASLSGYSTLTLSRTNASLPSVAATVDVTNDGAATPCVDDAAVSPGAGSLDISACLSSLDLPLTVTFRFTTTSASAKVATVSGISMVASGSSGVVE